MSVNDLAAKSGVLAIFLFEWVYNASSTLSEQFQISVDINVQEKLIYLDVSGFNRSYSTSYVFTVWNEITYVE
jgi:hypothetical protein